MGEQLVKIKYQVKIGYLHIKYYCSTLLIAILLLQPFGSFGQILTGVDPDEGMQGQFLELTISGQNTSFLQGTDISVTLQQGSATVIYPEEIGFVNNEKLYVTFGLSFTHDPGSYDLRVYEEPDGEMILEDAFGILENPDQPELISVMPSSAEIGHTLDLMVSGQFTHFQASTTTMWLMQGSQTIYPQYYQMISDDQISAHFSFGYNLTPGLYDVKVYDYLDGVLTLPESFNLLPGLQPSLTQMDPSSGMVGELLVFDIYGENTHFEDASMIMAYLENDAMEFIELEFQTWTNEHIEGAIIIPFNVSPGIYELFVFNSIDGFLNLPEALLVNENPDEPEIFSISPDSCFTNQQLNVEIEVENSWYEWSDEVFVFLAESNSGNKIWATNVFIENNEQLMAEFEIPNNANPGFWDVNISDDICGDLVLEAGMMLVDTLVGIAEKIHSEDFIIYPNPGKGRFYVMSGQVIDHCDIIISNMAGQQKRYESLSFWPDTPVALNLDNFAEGMYFVQIVTQNEIINKKFIKQ